MMMMMYPDKNDKKNKRKCSAWTPILEIAKNAVQIGSHHQDTCMRPVLEEMRLVHEVYKYLQHHLQMDQCVVFAGSRFHSF